ncbi:MULTISPECIES: hypothetical protein [Lactobacillus]|nr:MULTISPECIES: hypothetical protein [Lactobacillus]
MTQIKCYSRRANSQLDKLLFAASNAVGTTSQLFAAKQKADHQEVDGSQK